MRKAAAVTIAELETWPPVVNVADAARALDVSRATAYAALAEGNLPVRTIRVGRRIKVVTASIIDALSANAAA